MPWRSIKTRLFKTVVAAFLLTLGSLAQASNQTYGVLVYADSDLITGTNTRQDVIERIEQMVVETNLYYANSGVNLSAELQRVVFSNFTGGRNTVQTADLLGDMVDARGIFSNALAVADEYGADYIYAVTGANLINGSDDLCGQAQSVNTSISSISATNRSFAVSEMRCGERTFAHELGHLMGQAHGNWVADCEQDDSHRTAIAPYAKGFAQGQCNDFSSSRGDVGTIMAGNYVQNTLGYSPLDRAVYLVPLFSNITGYEFQCIYNGGACGDASYANSARSLNENISRYVSHEEPDIHTFKYADSELKACITSGYKYKEVSGFSTISCYNQSIKNLSGLENLTDLSVIDFSYNPLVSAKPLLSFEPAKVSQINLTGVNNLPCYEKSALAQRFGAKVQGGNNCFPLITIITSGLL